MTIQVLDATVAAQIAAGEVVERPASVARELIENAIDAGARRITVELHAGGLQELKVQDDGVGIASDEIKLAFMRHATSKLSNADDLWRIGTLGFRGEALPSIASVSQLICISRHVDAAIGTELRIAGGELQARTPVGCPPGTSISVRHLFYNTPVRREFLRSESSEASAVIAAVSQYALAYPEIRYSMLVDGRTALQSPGDGDLQAVLIELYGLDLARQLLPVELQHGEGQEQLSISGFISPPGLTRSTRSGLHIFINRRVIVPRGAIAAVIEEAYHSLLMRGRHPLAVLNIAMSASRVDVNVHPTKSEVKFRDPARVYSVLGRAIRDTLLASGAVLWGETEASTLPDLAQRRFDLRQLLGSETSGSLLSDPELCFGAAQQQYAESQESMSAELPVLRILGQLAHSYIVAELAQGLCLIDQHAAHERILYERYATRYAQGAIAQQTLLEPLSLHFQPDVHSMLLGAAQQLQDWGFLIEEFGSTLRVRAIPAELPAQALGSVLTDIAAQLGQGSNSQPLAWEEQLLSVLACHTAVRAGQLLNIEEMQALVADLAHCSAPNTCPHGRPTMIVLGIGQLERQFGRRS